MREHKLHSCVAGVLFSTGQGGLLQLLAAEAARSHAWEAPVGPVGGRDVEPGAPCGVEWMPMVRASLGWSSDSDQRGCSVADPSGAWLSAMAPVAEAGRRAGPPM